MRHVPQDNISIASPPYKSYNQLGTNHTHPAQYKSFNHYKPYHQPFETSAFRCPQASGLVELQGEHPTRISSMPLDVTDEGYLTPRNPKTWSLHHQPEILNPKTRDVKPPERGRWNSFPLGLRVEGAATTHTSCCTPASPHCYCFVTLEPRVE